MDMKVLGVNILGDMRRWHITCEHNFVGLQINKSGYALYQHVSDFDKLQVL